jgi:hypothetical protein
LEDLLEAKKDEWLFCATTKPATANSTNWRRSAGVSTLATVATATAERGPHARSIGREAATGPFVWKNLTAAAKLAILAALLAILGALLLFASGLCSQLWWTSSPGRSRPTVPSSPVPFPGAVP